MMSRKFTSIRFTFSDDDSVVQAVNLVSDLSSEKIKLELARRIQKIDNEWKIDDADVYTKGYYYLVFSGDFYEIFDANSYSRTFINVI